MLREYLELLCKELNQTIPKLNKDKVYPLQFGNDTVSVKDLEPGMALHAQMCTLPTKKKEELFMYLCRANLLGQGTGGCRIGIDEKEKFLTLSLGLPYEMNYQTFKETLEDFVNYVYFWKAEVTKFENEESVY
jgi:hypothetical protein